MAQNQQASESALEIDRLAVQLAKDPRSKVFMPLAEEYGKVGMWSGSRGRARRWPETVSWLYYCHGRTWTRI